jgi:hypothetical protein
MHSGKTNGDAKREVAQSARDVFAIFLVTM